MVKHTYDYVYKYIEESGDQLISEDYESMKNLTVKCGPCSEHYEIPFGRYQHGRRHTECKNKHLRDSIYIEKMKPRSLYPKINSTTEVFCVFCKKKFKQKQVGQILCDAECRKKAEREKSKTGHYQRIGRKGGLVSARVQVRRSKNEIYFAILCGKVFENVLTNEPIFDGWDTDVILPDLKIAISWNGIWHYKQVRSDHDVEQVQSRDALKNDLIIKKGYKHYTIKDLGGESKKFVMSEFEKFLTYLKEIGIELDEEKIELTRNFYISHNELKIIQKPDKHYKTATNKKQNKCIDCQENIHKRATRCVKCHNKSIRKVERPSLEILKKETKEMGFSATGRKYGVSDNAVRKWIKNYEKELL